jgi:membrane protease YdiL (CAAX protease family)
VLVGLAYGWYLGDGSAGSLVSGALLGVGLCLLRRAGQSLTLPIATHGAYASTHLVLVYMNVLT